MPTHSRPIWAVVLVAALLLASGPSAAQVGPARTLWASFQLAPAGACAEMRSECSGFHP